jgi:predicted transcriptional regulator
MALLIKNTSITQVAKEFGVSQPALSLVLSGRATSRNIENRVEKFIKSTDPRLLDYADKKEDICQ